MNAVKSGEFVKNQNFAECMKRIREDIKMSLHAKCEIKV